jgi:hypothetical protein
MLGSMRSALGAKHRLPSTPVSLVPDLQGSPTWEGGSVSADSNYSGLPVTYVFQGENLDTDPSTAAWASGSTSHPHWIQVAFNIPKTVVKIRIYSHDTNDRLKGGRFPKHWRFEGSNDESNWNVLYENTNESYEWGEGNYKDVEVQPSDPERYLYYRYFAVEPLIAQNYCVQVEQVWFGY